MAGSFVGGKNELISGKLTSVTPPPPIPNPLAIWKMQEGSGVSLNDTGGSADNATITPSSAVTWQSNAGLPGFTPLWNGSGHANAASTTLTNFDGTTPFTVSLWMNPSSLSGAMISTLSGANTNGWAVEMNGASSPIAFFLINAFPANGLVVSSNTGSLSTGVLHHVVVTYDGSRTPAGVKIYIDGVSVATSILLNTLTATAANGTPISFGARPAPSTFYSGSMAFVRIYTAVLTAPQVSVLFGLGPQ